MSPLKFDERDTIFSRAELEPGTQQYEEYYRNNAEKKNLDDAFRRLPGYLAPDSREADAVMFASANANLYACDNLQNIVDGPATEEKIKLSPEKITRYLKEWIKRLGAHSVGITHLQDYHVYSVGGRKERYGIPIQPTHTYAIAFTVEINFSMVKHAPYAPAAMEYAQQYLHVGTIAVQVAAFLRSLGYSSRAHIDANYQVICPLVARDAGLGEIGRMSILMTPDLGPRVRIAVVTTEAPFLVDRRTDDKTIIDFCKRCKKCAVSCPAQAISYNDREHDNGISRWKINHEKCYTYWCDVGTDCARCVAVCPYAYPDTLLHNTVRYCVKHFALFRRIAPGLDTIFYGKKPKPAPLEDWQKVQKSNVLE